MPKGEMTKKILWCGILAALTIYAPIELSRLIVITGVPLDELFELIMFWSFYLVALLALSWLVFKGRLPGIDN